MIYQRGGRHEPGTPSDGRPSACPSSGARKRPRPRRCHLRSASGQREAQPFLLDFFPLEAETETRLSRFFDRLREGRLSTTRCPKDDRLLWPPRTVCPHCHTEELEWVDLPERGRIYAFSAVLAGAPLGMESDVPFAVGLVDLDGIPLRLFGRIEGRSWDGCGSAGPSASNRTRPATAACSTGSGRATSPTQPPAVSSRRRHRR